MILCINSIYMLTFLLLHCDKTVKSSIAGLTTAGEGIMFDYQVCVSDLACFDSCSAIDRPSLEAISSFFHSTISFFLVSPEFCPSTSTAFMLEL